METLAYEHTRRPPPRRRPRWIDGVAWSVGLSMLALFALALPVTWGAVQYTRKIPLREIVAYVAEVDLAAGFAVSPWRVWQACFVPLAVLLLLVFSFLRSVRASVIVASAASAMPLLWLGPLAPVAVAIAVLVVPSALLGREDGESWSEGFVMIGAMGAWTLLWLALLLVILLTKKSWPLAVELPAA